ncbi:unknown [Alistipes sp. CAG:435]|nr:unknown [Alistipes sp. CAG:435]
MFGDGKFQRLQTSCINIQVLVFGITDVEQFSAGIS